MSKTAPQSIPVNGKKEASELLAALDPGTRERILGEIEKSDPSLAVSLRQGMVNFDLILSLDSPSLQKILRMTPESLVALSLRGLAPESEALFFSKTSERQGRAFREERDRIGPHKLSEVESAREKISEIARTLHDQGEINLFPEDRR